MPGHFPSISGDDAARVFERLGYARIKNNSYIRLKAPGRQPLTIRRHEKLKQGYLRFLIQTAGITEEEFRTLHQS